MRIILGLVTAGALVGCAARTPQACDPVPSDVVAAANQLVYSRCQVDSPARAPSRMPRMQFTPRQTCGSAAFQVVIDAEGRVVAHATRVLRSNDPELSDAYLNSVAAARFRPAMKDGEPVAMLDTLETGYSVITVRAGAPVTPSRASAPRC